MTSLGTPPTVRGRLRASIYDITFRRLTRSWYRAVLERVPAQRWGEPSDVTGAVLFLASDAAAYVSGHTIPVDGGVANVVALS